MASEWPTVTIGDVAKIKHGFAFKSEFFTDEVTPNVLVTPGNFAIGGGFQVGKPKYYAGPLPDDYVLSEGAVVVTMTDLSKASDTLGYAAKVPVTIGVAYWHNQRIGLLQVKDEQRVCKDWLHYLMRTYEYRAWIVGSASGTTVKHTAPSRIESFAFSLPPLEEQLAAAETLDALDDRIANLRQTNATLQAIAAALFKSWFVDFDGVPPEDMQKSELGLIPKRWRVGTLDDVLSLRNERTQPSKETAALPYVPIESIGAKNPFLSDWMGGENANSSLILFKRGDILFGAMRPYFHKVCIAPFDGVTRTTVFTLKPTKPEFSAYALMLAYQDETIEWATSHSEGSTIPYAKWKNSFERMPVVLPPEDVRIRFGEIVSPLIEKANANIQQAATLANLRDALLPRLISGQLRVSQ